MLKKGVSKMNKIFLSIMTNMFLPFTALAGECWDEWQMGWGHMMNFGGAGMFMWIIFLIMAGVIMYLVVQASKNKGADKIPHETPLEILKKRYATGEVSKEQFDKMKNDLQQE
jgi:putative membrane protein